MLVSPNLYVRIRITDSLHLQVTHISRVGGNLQIRKEDVRANIFKPTVALPTMSVEEFGELELERARIQQVWPRDWEQLWLCFLNYCSTCADVRVDSSLCQDWNAKHIRT